MSVQPPAAPHRVAIADIDIPFWRMVAIIIKWAFAAIPAVDHRLDHLRDRARRDRWRAGVVGMLGDQHLPSLENVAQPFSTLPATASSFFSSSGSRASGAVISAVSSARSEPIGHGSCSRGKSLREPRDQRLRLLGIGGQHLDDVLHRDGVVVRVPAVEVGHHRDGRVANLRLARELRLRHVGHADHRIAELLVGHALGVAWRTAGLPCTRRCRRA